MKRFLAFSILLNLVLLGGIFLLLSNRQKEKTVSLPVLSEGKASGQAKALSVIPPDPEARAESFYWSQLLAGKDYRLYIANLRAIGCPEATIEDIVRGDTERVFARERSQLALDESGTGPWSRQTENQLVAALLNQPEPVVVSEIVENPQVRNNKGKTVQVSVPAQGEPFGISYPLFLQNVNWSALGFSASEQAAIGQVRQQYLSQMSHPDTIPGSAAKQNPGAANSNSNPADNNDAPANSDPDDQLQALLGAQGYAAYEQQRYYAWYQPQVMANSGAGDLTINPKASSLK
jgi:hypothetical protein